MKRVSIFWILFLLFWAVPFPMLMYYNNDNMPGSSRPVWALIWLGVSLLGWVFFFRMLFKAWVLKGFTKVNRLNNLMQNGEVKTATITQCTPVAQEVKGVDKYDVTVEMQNFVGTTIHDSFSINDGHPEQHNYQVGKKLKLRIDKTLQNNPYLQVDGARYNVPNKAGLVVVTALWLIVLAAVAWYFYYAYAHQNNGTGWRFLVFYHPLVLCPYILLLVSIFMVGSKLTQNQLKHKYWGYRATAQIISAKQTGVYINEQPQVRFNLQYTDMYHQQHDANFVKTISLLDVGVAQQKTIDIFYLADAPGNICLASEIDN